MADGPTPRKSAAVDDWETVSSPSQSQGDWETVSGPSDEETETPKKPLPALPRDLTGAAANVVYGDFLPQVGRAAKRDVSTAWQGLKERAATALNQLKADPSSIVPMWFGTEAGALEAAGKTVSAPVEAAFGGKGFDALSLAAGGDPDEARKYAEQGDSGGEFWEMMGKPLALLVTGEAVGRVGGATAGALASRSNDASIALMRDVVMRGSVDKTGVDLAEVQLARDAMQDAAQEEYGIGKSGEKALRRAAPRRSFVSPVTKPEAGNKALLNLSRKAVDLAGEPADKVNAVFGYMDGRIAAQHIRADLLNQAAQAERNGAYSYANALRTRAGVFDRLARRGTLGDIYAIKKTANRLSDVARNTQESIDLMDSYSAMASAIRKEVYPIYERNIEAVSPGQGFSLSQAGRKEGAAISFRNGLERSWKDAQERTGQVYRTGTVEAQAGRGMSPRHVATGAVTRRVEKLGIVPNPQGALNKDVVKGVGRVPPGQVRESLEVSSPAEFGPSPPTLPALPGKTFTFKIPAGLPLERQEGELMHSAGQVQRHAFESPSFTTSTAPTRTATFAPNGRIVAGPEGSMGADIRTATPPAPRYDVVGGGGMLETPDPQLAEETLERMESVLKRHPNQPELRSVVTNLKAQLDQYWEGQGRARISHTPPTMKYTPRQLAPKAKPTPKSVRRSLPALMAGWQREQSKQNPTDAWQNAQ